MPTVTTTYAVSPNAGFLSTPAGITYQAEIIPPYKVSSGVPNLVNILPGINATASNYTTTQGQGSSSVTANRHFRMHVGDWGKFYLNEYKCGAVKYTVVVERIDESEDVIWAGKTVEELETAGFSLHATPKGEAGYNFKLRVGDKIHFEVETTDDSQEMGLHVNDEDQMKKLFVGQKTLTNGLKVNVPLTNVAVGNLISLYGVCSAMMTGSSLTIEHPVDAVT